MKDWFYVKASLAATSGFGLALSDINEWLEFLGGIGALVVMGLTIYRFVKDSKK